MLLCFLGTFSAFKFSVRDVFESVLWDLLLPYEMTRVGGVFDSIPHSLEEATELLRRRCAPSSADLWILVVDELPMFQHLTRFELHHGEGCLKYSRRVLAAGHTSRVALLLI